MKFNWGVGIFIFLGLFLTAAAVFIIFAFRQNVDLVDEDYYERGADYTTQMEVDSRSAKYVELIQTQTTEENLRIGFNVIPDFRIDSGNIRLYRPSDSKLDLSYKIEGSTISWDIPMDALSNGRYVLNLCWYSEGLQFEVKRQLTINN